MPVLLFLPAYLSVHTTDSSKSLKAWEDNSILKQGFPEHSAFFLAQWCIIHAFWDHNFRIPNSNMKFYKKNRTCYPAFQFTVLYVILAKRTCLSSKKRQKFLSFIIKTGFCIYFRCPLLFRIPKTLQVSFSQEWHKNLNQSFIPFEGETVRDDPIAQFAPSLVQSFAFVLFPTLHMFSWQALCILALVTKLASLDVPSKKNEKNRPCSKSVKTQQKTLKQRWGNLWHLRLCHWNDLSTSEESCASLPDKMAAPFHLSLSTESKLYFCSAYCDGFEIFQSMYYKMNTEVNNEMKVMFNVFNINNRKWVCMYGML